MKTFTLFSIRDHDAKVVYVGTTTLTPEKRLADMMKGAKCREAAQYNQKISAWLRNQYETFQSPSYRVEGTFATREEANAAKADLMKEHTGLLNVNQPIGFRKV